MFVMLYVCNFVNWEIHCISCVFILVEFTKCLLWPDKKVLEGILFINAFLAPMIKLLHEYIPGTKKWESELGYFVLTFKALFFPTKKRYPPQTLSTINFSLIPLLYGLLRVFHYGRTEETSFSVKIWPNPLITVPQIFWSSLLTFYS